MADDEPLSVQCLADYQRAGRAWVAAEDGQAVGYLLLDRMPAAAHIEQVSRYPSSPRTHDGESAPN